MNELLFIIHIFAITASTLIALRLGKEALITVIALQALLANLFITKEISLFSLCVTCTDAFAVGSGLALNMLQEHYGKTITKKAIWISFFALLFYMVMSQIQLWYTPTATDLADQHYYYLLNITPRLVIASITAYLISQYIDYKLYGLLKKHTQWLVLKNYGSLLVSQLIDTIIFSFIGLYGIVHSLTHIIIFSYVIKLVTIIIATPLISLIKIKPTKTS